MKLAIILATAAGLVVSEPFGNIVSAQQLRPPMVDSVDKHLQYKPKMKKPAAQARINVSAAKMESVVPNMAAAARISPTESVRTPAAPTRQALKTKKEKPPV